MKKILSLLMIAIFSVACGEDLDNSHFESLLPELVIPDSYLGEYDEPVVNTVRVLSYNIRHCAGSDDEINYAATAGVLEALSPSVICLQEVDNGTTRANGDDQLAKLSELLEEFPYTYFSKSITYQGGGYGNGIMMKEAPISTTTIALPGSELRSIGFAEFENYVIGSTHLALEMDNRVASIELITTQAKSYGKPVYIAGDFNDNDFEGEFLVGMTEDWDIVSEQKATYPASNPYKIIDFVFALKNYDVNIVSTSVVQILDGHSITTVSDHCPLYADFLSVGGSSSSETIEIASEADMQEFVSRVNAGETTLCGTLMNDITLTSDLDAVSSYFGVFDGGEFSIIDLTINTPDVDGVALFAKVGIGGTVKNLTLENPYIVGKSTTGGIIAVAESGASTVSNCHVIGGSVTSVGNGDDESGHIAGGVVADTYTNVYDCSNNGTSVACAHDYAGGVVGITHASVTVTRCWNSGDVEGGADEDNGNSAGGVVGYAYASGSAVTNCYNTGDISGDMTVGGVVGRLNTGTSMSTCYNTGTATASASYCGGATAYAKACTVSYCYSVGRVYNEANNNLGGVVGGISTDPTLTNCYYVSAGAIGENGERLDDVANLITKLNTSASGFTISTSDNILPSVMGESIAY
ncbi:MAG: GLUG motif-containing protein [Rikenellaceae bacterium]